MQKYFTIVPTFLRDPKAFYQSVQNNEDLRGKSIALLISSLLFLTIYGLVTGLSHSWQQGLSTAVKMPALFFLTLLITLPALYFFSLALINVRFSVAQAGVVVLSGIGVSAFLLLGLAPVTVFFVFTSTNYAFFQLLAVGFIAVSGCTGLYYILTGFRWVDKDGELSRNSLGGLLLKAWVGLFGFVGAQMTWRLSPFIGDPTAPFALIQPSRDNFFVDVLNAVTRALGLRTAVPQIDTFISLYIGLVMVCIIIFVVIVFSKLKIGAKTA